LHVAASEGHLVVVEYLVEMGAKVNRSDRWGGSPLDDAHRHQQHHVVKFLRKQGATTGSVNQTMNFITAAAGGDLEEVQLLLEFITDINEGDYDKVSEEIIEFLRPGHCFDQMNLRLENCVAFGCWRRTCPGCGGLTSERCQCQC
jgi:ankyrin repeat protein